MARKGGRKDDDRQRRAMHANMNKANGKGSKKGRPLSSADAARMARQRWNNERAKHPPLTMDEVERIQASRSPAARRLDSLRTSKNIVVLGSDRGYLWRDNYNKYDLALQPIDTAPEDPPDRPPRPAADAPKHGDGRPHQGDVDPAPKPPRQPKVPKSQPPQPPKEQPVAEPEPEPAEPGPEPPQAPTRPKKAQRPADVPSPEPVAPEPDPAEGDGEEQPQVVLSRDHAREALELASWKPPELGVVPEVLPMHKEGVMTRLARLVTSDPAQAKKAAEYDLAEGGFLTGQDRRITVFDPNARRRLGGGDAANLSTRLGIPLKAGLSGLWRSAPRDRVNVELDRFLHELDAPPGTKLVPIRGELFRLADVEAVAKAMPGPVSLDAIPDGHLVVMQGNVAVAVKPASRQEQKEHSHTAQAIIRKRNGDKPRSPKEAALMQKVPPLRYGAKPRSVRGKKEAKSEAVEIENAAPAKPAAKSAPQSRPKGGSGQAARAKKAPAKAASVKSAERDLLLPPPKVPAKRASAKPSAVTSAERDLLVPPRRAARKQPRRQQLQAEESAAASPVAPGKAPRRKATPAKQPASSAARVATSAKHGAAAAAKKEPVEAAKKPQAEPKTAPAKPAEAEPKTAPVKVPPKKKAAAKQTGGASRATRTKRKKEEPPKSQRRLDL